MTIDRATLLSVPIFKGLRPSVLDRLAAIAELAEARQGTSLCKQGELPSWLHVVLDGQVTLSGEAPDGTNAVVEIVRPGGYFVLAAVLANLPYLMSAKTVTRSRLVLIQAAALRELAESEISVSQCLLRAAALDFRAMVRQVRDLKLRSTAQRLGCYLLALVEAPDARAAEVRLPFEKGLLAGRLGCRQENLSRAFASLRDFDVETRGAKVVLNDIPRLRAFALPDELSDTLEKGDPANQ
jgi:CRP/FNR family transcriptional activator FtrB